MNSPSAFQQPANRKGNGSLLQQYGSNDPISLPSHIVSFSPWAAVCANWPSAFSTTLIVVSPRIQPSTAHQIFRRLWTSTTRLSNSTHTYFKGKSRNRQLVMIPSPRWAPSKISWACLRLAVWKATKKRWTMLSTKRNGEFLTWLVYYRVTPNWKTVFFSRTFSCLSHGSYPIIVNSVYAISLRFCSRFLFSFIFYSPNSLSVSTICWSMTHLKLWTPLIIAQDQTNQVLKMNWKTTKMRTKSRIKTVLVDQKSTTKHFSSLLWSRSTCFTIQTRRYFEICMRRKVSVWEKTA